MGIALPALAPEKLIDYLGLLTHWNRAFNLTARRDPREMISKHILDSLSVMPYVGAVLVADIGSGAGLPGIPLAIALPETRFVLIDSNGKKTRFLFQVKTALGLDNMTVHQARVESFQPDAAFDTVLSRAFATLADMVERLRGTP